ncbi:MAG: hypothetical protein JNK87_11530 [Bryobacterales bacterium]|nr:hypothetical protein [Bryobacterales bacterium]
MWHPAGPFGSGPINDRRPPRTQKPPKPINPATTWWGIGQELTGHLGWAGKRMLHGNIMCCADPSRVAEFHAQQFRLCAGLGGSWSTVALLGLNIGSSLDLKAALTETDWGLALSTGVNTRAYIDAFRYLRPFAESAIAAGSVKGGLRALAGYESVGDKVRTALDLPDSLAHEKPTLLAMPVGIGFEAAFYVSMATDILLLNWTEASR